jgi:hypothetical protein
VLASGTPSSVNVRIGAAGSTTRATAAPASAGVQVEGVHSGSDPVAGPYLAGSVVNHTGVAQHNMPIFAVALRGGRVVGAGRALVPSLSASAAGAPTVFRIYLVGSSPSGARIELTPAPSVRE